MAADGPSAVPPSGASETLPAAPLYSAWLSSLSSEEISSLAGGLLVSVVIMAFSGPPAAVIWRTESLHRVSYYYVMVLCLLDCLLGAVTFIMVFTASLLAFFTGGIPTWTCTLFEAAINCCMNSVSVVMLVLGRDRSLSMQHTMRYPLLSTTAHVWRHLQMALLYGSVHGALFVGARAYFSDLWEPRSRCDALHWLVSPEYRLVAVVTVLANIFLDIGTIVYNAHVMYSAWKLKRSQVRPLATVHEEAQRSQNMRMFIFTFKLASVFLVCSLPYKLVVLLHGLGAHSSVDLIRTLGMVRMLYFILDGWTFCSNEELLDAMKRMLGRWWLPRLCGALLRRICAGPAVREPTSERIGEMREARAAAPEQRSRQGTCHIITSVRISDDMPPNTDPTDRLLLQSIGSESDSRINYV